MVLRVNAVGLALVNDSPLVEQVIPILESDHFLLGVWVIGVPAWSFSHGLLVGCSITALGASLRAKLHTLDILLRLLLLLLLGGLWHLINLNQALVCRGGGSSAPCRAIVQVSTGVH